MKDLYSRTIINIIDVKHCHNYALFNNDDLYEQLQKYLVNMLPDYQGEVEKFMKDNEKYIQDLVNDQCSLENSNMFFENLRSFKRKYIMK